MLRWKAIKKENIPGLLDHICEGYEVYAPVLERDYFRFGRIRSGSEVKLDYHNTRLSPKHILFPHSEVMFSYKMGNEYVEIEESYEEVKPLVIFGIRPCDIKGIALLERVFLKEPRDPYFEGKRKKTIIVGLGCKNAQSECFCRATGVDPCGEEGSDLFMVDLGEKLLISLVTDRGEELLKKYDVEDANEEEIRQYNHMVRRAREEVKTDLNLEGCDRILKQRVDDPLWEEIFNGCISCGICTYLCPTCHCFDICDETESSSGVRIRVWDSCQYPVFTVQASGFNPRDTLSKRMRQRVMHKFVYLPDREGVLGCTGCGRCVTQCPVNLDIRRVLKRLLENDKRDE